MALSDRQVLDFLSRMPFVDSAELALILGEPHAMVHRALADLLGTGIVRKVIHGTAHLTSSQRYYLTADGIGEAAGLLGFETSSGCSGTVSQANASHRRSSAPFSATNALRHATIWGVASTHSGSLSLLGPPLRTPMILVSRRSKSDSRTYRRCSTLRSCLAYVSCIPLGLQRTSASKSSSLLRTSVSRSSSLCSSFSLRSNCSAAADPSPD